MWHACLSNENYDENFVSKICFDGFAILRDFGIHRIYPIR